jgi:hypothetical protein
MRSKAPPPTSAREAVQGRRDKRSVSPIGDGAAALSAARAMPGVAAVRLLSAVLSFIIASALLALRRRACGSRCVDRG